MSLADEVIHRLKNDVRAAIRIGARGHKSVASKVIRATTPKHIRCLAEALRSEAARLFEMADEIEGKEAAIDALKGELSA
jgi:hypothetical protein